MIVNLDDFLKEHEPPTRSVKFTGGCTAHLIIEPTKPVQAGLIGMYGFIEDSNPQRRVQHFLFSNCSGSVSGKTSIPEATVALRLSVAIEATRRGLHVVDLMLPKAFGFSGNKLWIMQLKMQYPELT